MVRLKHIKSGAVVNVADEKAARLGTDWVFAEAPAAEPNVSKRPPGRPKKTTN